MNILKTRIAGVLLIEPKRYSDNRGFFAEAYSKRSCEAAGIDSSFVQDNHSLSATAGTVRGLHFQVPPHAQAKLVRCGRGAIFDVAVDIRKGSPTYGHWAGFELSAENGRQLFIPSGFAHGFLTIKPDSEIVYKCSEYYAPEAEGAVRWDDPTLKITWPLKRPPILSDKDRSAPLFSEIHSPFEF